MKRDANTQEVKESYLKLARIYHPDKHPEALEYFTHVTKAYETLADDHKRAIYDEESITDEEFFTFRIGPLKVNMFTLFLLSLFGCVGYYGYYLLILKLGRERDCPIDHTEFKKAA